MIKTASDFESAIKELTKDRQTLSQEYDNEMSSVTHNKIFTDIESELNTMYEQLRMLEDIKDYCKSSIIKSIEDEKVKLMDKLRVIEHSSDSFSDSSCVAFEVALEVAPDMEVRDRNGNTLPVMRNVNGQLEVDGLDSRRGTISSVKCTTPDQCYANTAQNLVKGGTARSFYILGEPAYKGVVETYEVMFKEPVRCNYINIGTVNCEAENFEALLNTKGSTTTTNITEGYIDETQIYGLRFSIRATNYEYRNVVIDKQYGYNFFHLLDDDYYKRRNTSKTVSSFEAGTDKKNTQRYVNEFIADAVKAERSL